MLVILFALIDISENFSTVILKFLQVTVLSVIQCQHGYLTQYVPYKFIPRISHSTLYCFKFTLILYSYNIIIFVLCQISQIFNYRFVFISFAVILFSAFINKTALFNIFFNFNLYFQYIKQKQDCLQGIMHLHKRLSYCTLVFYPYPYSLSLFLNIFVRKQILKKQTKNRLRAKPETGNIILFKFIRKLSLYIECCHTRIASALTKLLFDSK